MWKKWAPKIPAFAKCDVNFLLYILTRHIKKLPQMSLAVYREVPMTLRNGEQEHRFTLRLNPATESFRLESGAIKRSIFIGKRMFSKLFQLVRNEYGYTMGRIQYDNEQMTRGHASTTEHDQFKFTVNEGNNIEVMIEDELSPSKKVQASVQLHTSNETERKAHLAALMPSVLAALMLTKDLQSVATRTFVS